MRLGQGVYENGKPTSDESCEPTNPGEQVTRRAVGFAVLAATVALAGCNESPRSEITIPQLTAFSALGAAQLESGDGLEDFRIKVEGRYETFPSPTNEEIETYVIQAGPGGNPATVFISVETGEVVASQPETGESTMFAALRPATVKDEIALFPFRLHSHDFTLGEPVEISHYGFVGTFVFTSAERARLSFVYDVFLDGPDEEPTQVIDEFEFEFNAGLVWPSRILHERGSGGEEVLWELISISPGKSLEDAKPDLGSTLLMPLPAANLSKWDRSPAEGEADVFAAPPSQAMQWAKQDNAEVRTFHETHSEAILIGAEYQVAGVLLANQVPLNMTWQWDFQWAVAGNTFSYRVKTDGIINPGASSTHATTVVGNSENSFENVEAEWRYPLLSFSDAYRWCTNIANGNPGATFGYVEWVPHSRTQSHYGGRPVFAEDNYYCGGQVARPSALDANTGLLRAVLFPV